MFKRIRDWIRREHHVVRVVQLEPTLYTLEVSQESICGVPIFRQITTTLVMADAPVRDIAILFYGATIEEAYKSAIHFAEELSVQHKYQEWVAASDALYAKMLRDYPPKFTTTIPILFSNGEQI